MREQAVPVHVNLVVLVESIWTLQRKMKRSRTAVASFIAGLLEADALVVEARSAVALALVDFVEGPAGFADYLIARLNAGAGCSATFTFDADAAKRAPFQLVP